MKMIGLIGGLSWQSTATYYRLLNTLAAERLGGLHSAELLVRSVDFAGLEAAMSAGDWQMIRARLAREAAMLERAGAGCVLLCTNSMHKVCDGIEAALDTASFFHIADALGTALRRDGIGRVGLLGTRFTMMEPFYADRLAAGFSLATLTPTPSLIPVIDDIIFSELCHGVMRDDSRRAYLDIIDDLQRRGAEAIVLGCTEIEMLLKPGDHELPFYDTTLIHARHAVDWALQETDA